MSLAAWSPTAGEVELRLLGPMQLGPDSAPVVLGGRKQRAVLAALALQLGRSISVDGLVELLWATGPQPSQPRRTLQVYVANLRKLLRPHSLDIAAAGTGYRLVASRTSVDAALFEDLVAEATNGADDDPRRALALYEEADELWRGGALSDLADDFVELDEMARRLDELRSTASEQRLGLAVRYGDVDRAVAELDALVAAEPWRERAVASLMVGRYRQGRQADALAVATTTRMRLVDELGLDPSPLLRETEQAILEQRIEIGPSHGETIQRRPLRIKPLASPDSFVGREGDVVRVREAVDRARLITIVGPGGVGKTRLAMETALRANVATAMVDLVAVDARGVVPAVVDAVGLPAGSLDAATLGEMLGLQLGGHPTWIILDNAEHLLDAVAEVALALAGGAPSLTVVVTSRAPLAVPGEAVVELGPLDEVGARRLFVERAMLAGQIVDIADDAVRDAVDRVCAAVDGLPLAIELAANRLRTLRLSEMAAPMAEGLTVADGELRGGVAPHGSMLRTILWSYERLTADEQTMLQRLAVFPDGATAAAAEAVCHLDGDPFGVDHVVNLIADLVDQSLVLADHRAAPTRFRMLETIRRFAQERGRDADRAADVDRALWTWAQALAIGGAQGLLGERQIAARRQLDDELDNLRGAFERAVRAGDASALVMANELAYWRVTRGEVDISAAWLRDALTIPNDPTGADSAVRAAATTSLALATAFQFAQPTEQAVIDAALDVLRASGETGLLLDGLLDSAVPALLMFDDLDRGFALADEAIAVATEAGDKRRRSLAEGYQAAALLRLRRLDEAAALAEGAVDTLLDLHDEVGALLPMRAVWVAAWRRGDRDRLRHDAQRAETIEQRHGLGMYSTLGHYWLTALAVLEDEPTAFVRIDAALAVPGVPAVRQAYQALRSILLRRGGAAGRAWEELVATQPPDAAVNGFMAGVGIVERGWCEIELGRLDDARASFEQLATVPVTATDAGFRAAALEGRAAIAAATGRHEDAAALLTEAEALRHEGPAVLHLHEPEVARLRASLVDDSWRR